MTPLPRLRPSRLVSEALAGIAQRPSRSVLTVVGVALGVGSFVAVLGVTTTANGQINRSFDAELSSQITVEVSDNISGESVGGPTLPVDADARAARIDGVIHTGTSWEIVGSSVRTLPAGSGEPSAEVRILAASPGYWGVVEPSLDSGRVFDSYLEDYPVAVIGDSVAKRLGIADLSGHPQIFLDGRAFSVIGIISTTEYSSSSLSAIVVPASYARKMFGEPDAAATLGVMTRTGAAQIVAKQLALSLDPIHPESFRVVAPDNQQGVRTQVSTSIQSLFLVLALICLLVGAVGIANSTLLGVLSRTSEIGIRRSLGALPGHIAAQFLIECAVLGFFGGVVGAWAGLVTVIVVAIAQQWSAILQIWSIFAAPVVGALVGIAAGLYPSLRASRIEPVEAFRR